MAKREEFLCAWRTRFSVTDIPTDVVECLQSSNNKQLRKILKTCQAKVTELQNELHQQEFLASFLWEYLKDKPVDSPSHDEHCDLDKPIPVPDFSPNEPQESSSYDNIDDQHNSRPNSSDLDAKANTAESNVLPSQILRSQNQKPVPAPRASTHVQMASVKDRASVFVQATQKEPPPKLPNRGNSLDSKSSPSYTAKKEPSLSNSIKKDRPNVPPKRRHVHAYEEVDIPLLDTTTRPAKPNSFGKQNSVDYQGAIAGNITPNRSPSDVMKLSFESKPVEYENVTTGVSSFKPITRPKTSSLSPKLHRNSPVYSSKHKRNASPVTNQHSDEIYDEPIPVTADNVSDDDGSSSDDEPLYHNLVLLKKQQQSMDNRLYSSVDIYKQRLEHDAKKMSYRFSVNSAEQQQRKSMKPVRPPVMKPLKAAFISGVTEEESSTETGAHCCIWHNN